MSSGFLILATQKKNSLVQRVNKLAASIMICNLLTPPRCPVGLAEACGDSGCLRPGIPAVLFLVKVLLTNSCCIHAVNEEPRTHWPVSLHVLTGMETSLSALSSSGGASSFLCVPMNAHFLPSPRSPIPFSPFSPSVALCPPRGARRLNPKGPGCANHCWLFSLFVRRRRTETGSSRRSWSWRSRSCSRPSARRRLCRRWRRSLLRGWRPSQRYQHLPRERASLVSSWSLLKCERGPLRTSEIFP